MPSEIQTSQRTIAVFKGLTRALFVQSLKAKEIPQDSNPAVLTALLVGPLFYLRWFSREPLDEKFVRTVIVEVLD